MANIRLSISARNALASVYSSLIDAGGEPGTISFYTGPQPGGADSARLTRGQTLLATLAFAFPSAKMAEDGSIEFSPSESALMSASARKNINGSVPWIIEADSSLATGRAEWARVQDSQGNIIFDCDVSAAGGDGLIQINTTDIVEGGPVRVKNMVITIPAG